MAHEREEALERRTGSVGWFDDSVEEEEGHSFPRIGKVTQPEAVVVAEGEPGQTVKLVFEHSKPAKVMQQQQQEEAALRPPSGRWGQTATYLPDHNVVLFVGGQTNKHGNITNDVFALDLSAMQTAGSTTLADPTGAASTMYERNQWIRLSSEGLPPHAFAASAMTRSQGTGGAAGGEKLWIIGGVTEDCQNDAPAYYWSAPSGDFRQGFWSNLTVDRPPMRRRGANAVQLASSLASTFGSSSTSSSSSSSSSSTLSSSITTTGQNGTSSISVNANSDLDGTTLMVLGGTADSSVCFTVHGDNQSAQYPGLDIWLDGQPVTSSAVPTAAAGTLGRTASRVHSFAVDSRMESLPLVDYSTVLVPGNKSVAANATDKAIFIGGRDRNGQMTDLAQLWVLDLDSGDWQRWTTSGDIPTGRMGHSSVLTSDGKVVIHGGYLEDPRSDNNSEGESKHQATRPTDQVYVLDLSTDQPTWSQAEFDADSDAPPARAYHSAVMAGDVMVVAFGQASHGQAAGYRFSEAGAASEQHQPSIHYLNVGSGANAWSWSSSKPDVALASSTGGVASGTEAEQVASSPAQGSQGQATGATAAQSSSANGQQATGQAIDQSASSGNVAAGPAAAAAGSSAASSATGTTSSVEPSASSDTPSSANDSEAAAPASGSAGKDVAPLSPSKDGSTAANAAAPADPASSAGPDPTTESAPPPPPSSSSSSSHSGAIAGSVLGAAAVAGAIGGLYAYRKRREARAYALGQSSMAKEERDGDDTERFGDVHTTRNVGPSAPPVSNLWLHQPAAWASAAGRGLRRAASSATVLSLGGGWKNAARPAPNRESKDDAESIAARVGASPSSAYSRDARSPAYGESPYTTPTSKGAFQVLRNFRGSGSGRLNGRTFPGADADGGPLPDAFISSLASDESPVVFEQRDRTFDMRNLSPGDLLRVPAAPAAAAFGAVGGAAIYAHHQRNVSTDSFASSLGSVSHFSYPYLAAMHHPSLTDTSNAAASDSEGRSPRAVVGGVSPSNGSAASGSPVHAGGANTKSAAFPYAFLTSPTSVGATIAALNLSPRDAAALAAGEYRLSNLANPHRTPPHALSPYHEAVLMQQGSGRIGLGGDTSVMALDVQADHDNASTVSIDGVSTLDAGPGKPVVRPFAAAEPQTCASPLFPWQTMDETDPSSMVVKPPPRARLTETSIWNLMRRKSAAVRGAAPPPMAAAVPHFVAIDMASTVGQMDDGDAIRRKDHVDPFEDDDEEALILHAIKAKPFDEERLVDAQGGSDGAWRANRNRSFVRAKMQPSFRITNEA